MAWWLRGRWGVVPEAVGVYAMVFLLAVPSLASPWMLEEEDPETHPDRVLEVQLPGLLDQVELVPDDPRSPELAALDPDAADGLWSGVLQRAGWRLHLVDTPELSLGVLDHPAGAQWVTVEGNRVVPFSASGTSPIPTSPRVMAPPLDPPAAEGPGGQLPPMAGSTSVDGVVQIVLEGDSAFRVAWSVAWAEVQLKIIHLVSAVYEANLGFSFEVVDQVVWGTADPAPYEGADRICTGGPQDVLRQFRDHYEAVSPTTSDPRELRHLFTGKFTSGTIGCAYIRGLENSFAYGVSSVPNAVLQNNNLYRNVVLVAHEIGHNFGGHHSIALGASCNGGSVMYPILCFNSPVISGFENVATCRVSSTFCPLTGSGNAPVMWDYAGGRV